MIMNCRWMLMMSMSWLMHAFHNHVVGCIPYGGGTAVANSHCVELVREVAESLWWWIGEMGYPMIGTTCGVVFFTSPFHLGGRHAKPFTRNLEGEYARGGMNFVSVLPTISHELSYLSYE